MKNDLKKKFLDILFEPEEPEIVEDAPISEVRLTKPKTNNTKTVETHKETAVPKASEVLYGGEKPNTASSFINYKETSSADKAYHSVRETKEEKATDLSDTYELKRHISPIFGETETKSLKKEEPIKKPAVQTPPMPKGDFTGVVLSPIFGYDNASADKARTDFVKNKKKDSAILRQSVKTASTRNVKVEELREEPISLFEEPFDAEEKAEKYEEPFTSEIKVIDVEGEPIEEVKEEDDSATVKPYEVSGLDDFDEYAKKPATDSKSFIDDLLGDKD